MTATSKPNATSEELIAKADAAAAARRIGEALALLNEVVERGGASVDTLLKTASLHRANAEPRLALAMTERALALEPLHFLALFFRASILEHLGDRSAAESYGQALAQRGIGPLPPALQAQVERAQTIYAAHVATSREQLQSALRPIADRASPLEKSRLSRFASNVARETRVHHSEPTYFHYPGLAEYEFHDRSFFPWLDKLEAATDTIRAEFQALLASERADLVPYVQYDDTVPMQQWKPLNHNLDWTAIHLMYRGERVEANARHCPATLEVLAQLPQPDISGDAPNAMFSLLKPHTHIPPHHGVANFRLVCHLPLIVPPKCWFRVGAERRGWKEGEAFVFDDTIEHEAANESDELRVVLIVDVWHPGLSEIEKEGIRAALGFGPQVSGHL